MPVSAQKDRWSSWLARSIRCRIKRFRLKGTTVLAVTGSCGKTSASFFLSEILKTHGSCALGIEEGDHNGIYRTLRRIDYDNRYYVQETSGHLHGQMAKVMPLIRPHVGIVTAIGLDHYTEFRSREAVAKEKSGIVSRLKRSGTAVLNADDPHVAAMADKTRAKVIFFGTSKRADVRATEIRSDWPDRLTFTVHFSGESERIETNLFGDVLLPSLLGAIAAALAVGVSLKACAAALTDCEAYNRRATIHHTKLGLWMIEDVVKAPYWTLPPLVEKIARATAPRKTIIFGGISDAFGGGPKRYRQIAKKALEASDRVVCIGEWASHIRKILSPELEGRLLIFEDTEEASRFLKQGAIQDELIYLKSTNAEHLERLILAQEHELNCWVRSCKKLMRCCQCSESGLLK